MAQVSIDVWRSLSQGEWDAVEAEALSLPLPGLNGPITARLQEWISAPHVAA